MGSPLARTRTRTRPRARARRPLLAGTLLVALGFVLASCSSTDSTTAAGGTTPGGSAAPGGSGEAVTVRLGYFPNVTHAPALVGINKGFFAEALGSNTLETMSFNAGPEAIESLLADGLDITYIGPNPAINAYQKSDGEAIRIVGGSTSGGAYFVVNPEISTAEDLRGKTVSSPQLGGTQDVALRAWLKEQGLQTDTSGGGDVSIKPQANGDTLTAFKDGSIAGAWVPEPWATRLIQEGSGKVLVDEKTLWPEGRYVTTHIIVAKPFLDAHPDIVKAVLEANSTSIEFIEANPTEAQEAANVEIEKVTEKKLPEAVITASWKNLEFTSDPIASSLQKSADDAVAIGQLDTADVANIYDLTILNEILKAQGKPAVEGL